VPLALDEKETLELHEGIQRYPKSPLSFEEKHLLAACCQPTIFQLLFSRERRKRPGFG